MSNFISVVAVLQKYKTSTELIFIQHGKLRFADKLTESKKKLGPLDGETREVARGGRLRYVRNGMIVLGRRCGIT